MKKYYVILIGLMSFSVVSICSDDDTIGSPAPTQTRPDILQQELSTDMNITDESDSDGMGSSVDTMVQFPGRYHNLVEEENENDDENGNDDENDSDEDENGMFAREETNPSPLDADLEELALNIEDDINIIFRDNQRDALPDLQAAIRHINSGYTTAVGNVSLNILRKISHLTVAQQLAIIRFLHDHIAQN